MNDTGISARETQVFSLPLLESFVRVLQFELAQIATRLTDLQIGPLDRLIRHERISRSDQQTSTAPSPDHVLQDMDLLRRITEVSVIARTVSQISETILTESKQIWQSVEFISGNVHKIAFGTSRALSDPAATASIGDMESRQLRELAVRLVQQAEILQSALAEMRSGTPL